MARSCQRRLKIIGIAQRGAVARGLAVQLGNLIRCATSGQGISKRVKGRGASLAISAVTLTPTWHTHALPSWFPESRLDFDDEGGCELSGPGGLATVRFETYPGWVRERDKARSERGSGFRFGSLPSSRVHRSTSGLARKVRNASTVARQLSKPHSEVIDVLPAATRTIQSGFPERIHQASRRGSGP